MGELNNNDLEQIMIGTFVTLDDNYLGFDEHGNKAFVTSVTHATLYIKGLTPIDAYHLLTQHDIHKIMDIEDVDVIPVKKVISYQLGEF
jgi:hypothetical protein